MNATKRSAARAGLVVCSVLAVALTGCRTHVVHERTRTVYVPAPPPVVQVQPAPAPQPPVVVAAPPEQPPVVVIQSENDFYEPLTAYGRWVVVGSYGRCWIPARVEEGWRPYSNGYWQRTDAGWYWVSEEPWGWATYHYGRWDFHAQFGWIWVPHTQWAPAWVAWREGGGYVGWAPLRPSVTVGVNIHVGDYEPAFASRAFVFVEHRRMLEPVRPKTVIVNNTTIINKTVNITNVKVVNKTVINEGPRPEVIERASGRKVHALPAHDFRRKEEATVAVAARRQNIPTVPERKGRSPASTKTQAVPEQAVLPRNAQMDEKPYVAVTPPARPLATPARPTAPPIETRKPARVENRQAAEPAKKITTSPSTIEPQAQSEARPAQPVPPRRDLRPVEKPAVATRPTPPPVTTNPVRETVNQPPGRPLATPARPTAPPIETGKPARVENRQAVEPAKKITTTPPTIAPKAQSEVMPAQPVPPRRDLRPVEKPALATRPTPPPVTTNPIPGEQQRERAVEKQNTATPPTVVPRPRNEVRSETRTETKPPVKVETAPAAGVKRPAAPPVERHAAKRLVSPREESRAAEQAEANKKTKEDKGPKKKGEDRETPPAAPTRPAR